MAKIPNEYKWMDDGVDAWVTVDDTEYQGKIQKGPNKSTSFGSSQWEVFVMISNFRNGAITMPFLCSAVSQAPSE